VTQYGVVRGTVNTDSIVRGTVSAPFKIDAVYDGEYDVVPDLAGKTLNTANRRMEKDVNVLPVPVARTTNTSGGETVTIC
jgi:hypothetical protein